MEVNPERVIVVAGFPRSGTSLMMRMLHRSGIEVLADNHASYEDRRAQIGKNVRRQIHIDPAFLTLCKGKAVKILEPMGFILPMGFSYDFIVMTRNPAQQARSQAKLMQTVGFHVEQSDIPRIAQSIIRDQPAMLQMLSLYAGSKQHIVTFEGLLLAPLSTFEGVAKFLGLPLDCQKAASAVVKRGPECYNGFLEEQYLDL